MQPERFVAVSDRRLSSIVAASCIASHRAGSSQLTCSHLLALLCILNRNETVQPAMLEVPPTAHSDIDFYVSQACIGKAL